MISVQHTEATDSDGPTDLQVALMLRSIKLAILCHWQQTGHFLKLELSGAHILRACSASGLHWPKSRARVCWQSLPTHYIALLCAWAESTWPAVDRSGQQKHSICDTCGPCPTIRSIVKPVFHQFRQVHCAFELLRYLYLAIGQFLWQQTDKTDCFTPCACAWGNYPLHMHVDNHNTALYTWHEFYHMSDGCLS